jgi:serine/threonine protein kinase
MPAGSGPVLTRAGLIFGTARYISPEGAAGQPVGPSGDVYAISTVLYQALAGRTPFEGESAVEVLARQINEPPAPLRSHARASYVPEPIAEVITANLAKRPEQRSPDARALARALLDAARGAGLSPEALVARSALFGEPAHEPAFVSAEPTRQLEFGADLAQRVGVASAKPARGRPSADSPAVDPTPGSNHPPPPRGRWGTRGTLAFLLGCVAGGVGLAALGVRWRADGPAGGTHTGDDEPALRGPSNRAASITPDARAPIPDGASAIRSSR